MDVDEVELHLEDAVLRADAARVAAILLPVPVDDREATFGDLLHRLVPAMRHYPAEVYSCLLLARALVAKDAADTAAELGEDQAADIDQHVLALALADRLPTWIAELVWHLGDEVNATTDHRLVTIETLCAEWGVPRPTAHCYLTSLAGALGAADLAHGGGALGDMIVRDDSLRTLVPALLATPGIGTTLAESNWAAAIAEGANEGLFDRAHLIDAVLAARSGREPAHLLWFLDLHERLDPTNAEISARMADYLGLIRDSRDPVVEVVVKTLRERDSRRRLPLDLLLGITRIVLQRPHSAVALQQIAWAEQSAVANPDSAEAIAVALTDGFGSSVPKVRERSLRAIVSATVAIDREEPLVSAVLEAAEALPEPLRSQAVATFAGPVAVIPKARQEVQAAPVTPVTHTARHSGSETSGTSHDTDDVCDTSTLPGLVNTCERFLWALDVQLGELVLDGVAALAGADLAATRQALTPISDSLAGVSAALESDDPGAWLGERPVLAMLACLALPDDHPVQTIEWSTPVGPVGCLTLRAGEVLERVRRGESCRLLSLPTSRVGTLNANVLAERLEAIAAAGGQPWPLDLEQALLRAHSAIVPPEALTRLGGVTLAAADVAARRLRGGVHARPALRVKTAESGKPLIEATTHARMAGDGPLTLQAFDLSQLWRLGVESLTDGHALTVLMTLPNHREAAAGYLGATLAPADRRHLAEDLEALALLPKAGGRTGEATALALLYGACAADRRDRRSATTALAGFARHGGLDPVGAAQVWVSALQHIDLRRLAETLQPVLDEVHGDRLVVGLLAPLVEAVGADQPPGLDAVAALLERAGDVDGPSEQVGTPAAEPVSSRRRSRHARSALAR